MAFLRVIPGELYTVRFSINNPIKGYKPILLCKLPKEARGFRLYKFKKSVII